MDHLRRVARRLAYTCAAGLNGYQRLRKENQELLLHFDALLDVVGALLEHGPRPEVLDLLQATYDDFV